MPARDWSSREWSVASLRTVERVLAMRIVGLVGVIMLSILMILISTLTGQPRGDVHRSCDEFGNCVTFPPAPDRGTPAEVYVIIFLMVLLVVGVVVFSYGPATGAAVNRDGKVVFYGGFLPFRAVPVAEIDRISVGALYLRGLVFFHCGRRFPVVMLGPVDGLARLVEAARDRGVSIQTDGV